MAIINFAISKPLENQVNEAIEKYGFASKAEFFRFSAMEFVNKKDDINKNSDEDELKKTVQKLTKLVDKKFNNKKFPSAKEQLSNL